MLLLTIFNTLDYWFLGNQARFICVDLYGCPTAGPVSLLEEGRKTAQPVLSSWQNLEEQRKRIAGSGPGEPCQFFSYTVENSMCFLSHSNIFTPLVPLIKLSLFSWIQRRDPHHWLLICIIMEASMGYIQFWMVSHVYFTQ